MIIKLTEIPFHMIDENARTHVRTYTRMQARTHAPTHARKNARTHARLHTQRIFVITNVHTNPNINLMDI